MSTSGKPPATISAFNTGTLPNFAPTWRQVLQCGLRPSPTQHRQLPGAIELWQALPYTAMWSAVAWSL